VASERDRLRRTRRASARHGRKPRPSFVPAERAIQQRPGEVAERRTFGHGEADRRLFRREHGKANLTSLLERRTRCAIRLANPDRRSSTLVGRMVTSLQELPAGSCKSVTFDRGTELAAYDLLTDRLGAQAWFCDPHSPWQKAAIENTNGRIRRFLPSERNPAELSVADLARWVSALHATPRRCLGYRIPHEAFHDQLAALTRAA
jgi:IS30 family transposase